MSTTKSNVGPSFQKLERRLRRALAWRGAADLLILLAVAVLGSLALDWLFELPWLFRLAVLLAFVWGYLRVLLAGRRRTRGDVAAEDLLAAVENSEPGLQGQLVNAVELRSELRRARHEGRGELEIYLLRRALRESQHALTGVDASRALDLRSLRGRQAAAFGGILLVLVLALSFPSTLALWAQRNVLLSHEPWPRYTHFALDWDVDWQNPVRHVARKEKLEITGWVVGRLPRDVYLHIEAPGQHRKSRLVPEEQRRMTWNSVALRGREALCSEELAGAPAPGEEADAWRLSFTMPSVVDSFGFYFSGGDNRSRMMRVEVHDRPRIVSTRLDLRYPSHTIFGSAADEEKVIDNPAGEIAAPQGTDVALMAETDQDITEPWVRFGQEGRKPGTLVDARSLRHTFVLKTSGFLQLGMKSARWGSEGEPKRLALVALPDRPPEVRLTVKGKNRIVTPQGRIGYGVEASDDYGISSLRLRFGIDTALESRTEAREEGGESGEGTQNAQQGIVEQDLAPWDAERVEGEVRVEVERHLELEPLPLVPGTELHLQAVAVDNDEPAGLKISYSNTVVFLVVAPEKLREEMDKVRVAAQVKLEELSHRESGIADKLLVATAGPAAGGGQPQRTATSTTGGDPAVDPGEVSERNQESREREDEGKEQNDSERAPSDSRPSRPSASAESSPSASSSRSSPGAAQEGASRESAGTTTTNPSREGSGQGSRDARNESRFGQLAEEQEEVAREARELTQTLQEMAETLTDNELMNEAESRRFDEEVLEPLGDLGQERLPRSAQELQEIPRSGRPQTEAERVGANLERLSRALDQVAERLGESADFREILQRLEIIVELQKGVITETEREAGADGSGKSKEDAR